jgi:hypothetical protein
MNARTDIHRRSARPTAPHNDDLTPSEVQPFGRYGGGHITGHPIGLVIVLGLFLMGFVGVPAYRWFFAGSLALGGVFGFLLWLRHR